MFLLKESFDGTCSVKQIYIVNSLKILF